MRLGTLIRSSRAAGLLDQALFSLATFAQTVIYARTLPSIEFGLFAMALSTVLLAQTLQRCVVILPMVVSVAQAKESVIRPWARLNGVVIALALAALALVGLTARLVAPEARLLPTLCAMAALCLPAVFSFEFVRRALYVEQKRGRIAGQASAYFTFQLAGVGAVVWSGGGGMAAIAATAAAALLAALIGALALTWKRQPDDVTLGALVTRYRTDMGWSLAAALPYAGFNTSMPMILGFVSSPVAAGVFTATRLLLAPVTTLIAAIDNVDKPRAARALRDEGSSGLVRSLRGTLRSLLIMGGAYLLLAGVFSDQLLRFLLGARYSVDVGFAWIWLVVGLLMMFGQPMETGLLILRRTRWYFWSRFLALLAAAAVLVLGLQVLAGHAAGVIAVAAGWLVSGGLAAGLLRYALGRARAEDTERRP